MPDIKPISSTQVNAVATDKKASTTAANNNNRPFNFLWNLRSGLGLDSGVDTDVIKANEGDLNALKGEEVKMIPKDILLKALKSARIEQTEQNIEIVKALVKENLPLTPKNISRLVTQSSLHKEVSLETLAMMMRHDIPMTEENVRQFEQLIKTGENLADKINRLVTQIPAEIINGSKNLSELSGLFSRFSALSKLVSTNVRRDDKTDGNRNVARNNTANNNNSSTTANNINNSTVNIASLNKLMESVIKKSEILNSENHAGTREAQQRPVNLNKPLLNNAELRELINALRTIKTPTSLLNRIININAETMRPPPEIAQTATTATAANAKSPVQSAAEEILNIVDRFIREIDVRTQGETVRKPINTNDDRDRERNRNENTQTRTQRPIINIEDIGGRKELFENIKNLLNNKSFNKIIESAITEKWLLKPQNMSMNEVESVFSKLNENLNQFIQQFREVNLPNVRADAKDIQDAVKLVNDLNKSMPFLQIPIKLSGQIANSELYVLTKIKKDGQGTGRGASSSNLNVLLKLELNNLGSLDIYVNMNGKNIRSKFFSEKDETLGLIREYLPELNSSITKLGFSFRSSVTKTERGFDFVEDFLNRELPRTEFRRQALHMNI